VEGTRQNMCNVTWAAATEALDMSDVRCWGVPKLKVYIGEEKKCSRDLFGDSTGVLSEGWSCPRGT
jgi:hypothetical protein